MCTCPAHVSGSLPNMAGGCLSDLPAPLVHPPPLAHIHTHTLSFTTLQIFWVSFLSSMANKKQPASSTYAKLDPALAQKEL